MRPVTRITIIYDAASGFCTHAKEWISRQAPLLELRFVASDSSDARRRFPQLPAGELAAVADTGEVWLGNHAWIVCLWALQCYRELALKLTSPLLLLLAREAFAVVSRNRFALSYMFRLRSERELEQQLRRVPVPKCKIEPK